MANDKTIYKIYQDINNMPKDTMFLRPLGMGIGTGIGTFIGFELVPDKEGFLGMCTGAAGLLLGRGIYNAYRFKKQRALSELAEERLEVFKNEAKKILGENVNLDFDNTLDQAKLSISSLSFEQFGTRFKDGGCIMEISCDGYHICHYCKSPEEERPKYVDLSSAVDIAYSKVPSKNKKV